MFVVFLSSSERVLTLKINKQKTQQKAECFICGP